MMGKNKLKRFAEMETLERVFQPTVDFRSSDHELKGKWNEIIFKNNHPIILELGCGRGEYTVELAKRYPEKNFIGIDIKGARLWRGAKSASEQHIPNMAFLRIRIDLIEIFFAPNEIAEIWITFPDPQPRESKANKRLSSPYFLDKYKRMLRSNGLVHLKTDSMELFDYTIEVLKNEKGKLRFFTADLYNESFVNVDLDIQTTYEKIFRTKKKNICYLCFEFKK